jgi:hypothetical protein
VGITTEQLFRLAVENVRRDEPRIPPRRVDSGESYEILLLAGQTLFTSSHVFILEEYLNGVAESATGAFVGMPYRDALLFSSIGDLRSLQALRLLAPAVAGRFKEGPAPVSDQVYWWSNGTLHEIGFELGPGGMQLSGPDESRSVTQSLS